MNWSLKPFVFLYGMHMLLVSCTEDPLTLLPEDRVVVNQVSEDYSASITQDSLTIIRGVKDGSQVGATIKYQAITYEDIDSVQWIFKGGTPGSVKDTLNPTVQFNGYGLYPAQLILTKYDTVSDKKITIRRDTLEPEEPLRIIFEERNWIDNDWSVSSSQSRTTCATPSPTTTSSLNTNSWTSFPFSNMVIMKETNVNSKPLPYHRMTQFSGFNNQRVRLTFEYKISRKGGSQRFTGNNRKFDVIVDGFTRLQVNKTPNDTYQNGFITINEANEFCVEILKYPGMTRATWNLNPTNLPTFCQPPIASDSPSYTSSLTITTAASLSIDEGQSTVGTIAANRSVIFSVVSSTDANLFSIDLTSGALSFSTPPDYEVPSDSNADNVYEIVIQAREGSGDTVTKTFSISVNNIDENQTAIALNSIELFQEYNNTDTLFGFIDATNEKNYFYLNYTQSTGSTPYQFGTDDQSLLSLTADCPIALNQGKYKVFIYLDEGFPASFNAVKLPNTATYSSTIIDPNFFDLFIKNFKIEAF